MISSDASNCLLFAWNKVNIWIYIKWCAKDIKIKEFILNILKLPFWKVDLVFEKKQYCHCCSNDPSDFLRLYECNYWAILSYLRPKKKNTFFLIWTFLFHVHYHCVNKYDRIYQYREIFVLSYLNESYFHVSEHLIACFHFEIKNTD